MNIIRYSFSLLLCSAFCFVFALQSTAQCSSAPSQPGAISGTTPVCENTTQTYFINSVAGATSYSWSFPGGWSGTSLTNSITVTAGANSGNIQVFANNACGSSPAQTMAVVAYPAPPAAISPFGNVKLCIGRSIDLNANIGTGLIHQWFLTGLPILGANADVLFVTTPGTYSVKITDGNNCSTWSNNVTIINYPLPLAPSIQLIGPDHFCGTGSTQFTTNATGATGNIVWSNGANSQNIYVTQGGGYWVSVVDTNGCRSFSDTIDIIAGDYPLVNAGPDISFFVGETDTLQGSGNGTSFAWSPTDGLSDGNIATPIVNISATATYILTVTGSTGCTSSDTVVVMVNTQSEIAPATLFTPNGDGKNDVWLIAGSDKTQSMDIVVFGRYGDKVYESKGLYTPWDGNWNGHRVPDATYYYHLKYVLLDGTAHEQNGSISILR